MKTGLVVPTLNAAGLFADFLAGLRAQTYRPGCCLIIDSSSSDATRSLFASAGFAVHRIERQAFDHGGTRQLGLELLPGVDVIVFLTQDAILATPEALQRIIDSFSDARVGAAYGRQIPRQQAGPIEAHARLFNYPPASQVRTINDVDRLGIKTPFLSNSFAAYRRASMLEVGGFPRHVIFGEDMYVAARLLLAGWHIAYRGDAPVRHSHHYTFRQEFRRYFDIGVFHHREEWLLEAFGRPNGEGWRYLKSELRYVGRQDPALVASALVRNGLKFLAYQLGRRERRLPTRLKSRLGMNGAYWWRD